MQAGGAFLRGHFGLVDETAVATFPDNDVIFFVDFTGLKAGPE